MGSSGRTSIRRAGVFVRAGDLAFLPHLLFGTPIKSHSFRTFPARSRLSAGGRPHNGGALRGLPIHPPWHAHNRPCGSTGLAQAFSASDKEPHKAAAAGGEGRAAEGESSAAAGRGTVQRPRASSKAGWRPREEPPKAEPGGQLFFFLGDPGGGAESQFDQGGSPAPSQCIWVKCSGCVCVGGDYKVPDLRRPRASSSLFGSQH